MKLSMIEQILKIAKEIPVLRPSDLVEHGIPRRYLSRCYKEGYLHRVGRGVYVTNDAIPTELHSMAQVGRRVPKGVICLLSALQFHGLTTQLPYLVWVAIKRDAWRPKEPNLPLRIIRFSTKAFEAGIETHRIEGVPVKVYNAAKTVVDCFKYRNKIGQDIAIEALRDCLNQKKCTIDDLWNYAKICRVTNVMKPYLEMVT